MIRTLRTGQRCEVWIASVTGERRLVFATGDVLLEAPNWTPDGGTLVLNGDGKLWTLDVAGRNVRQVPLTGIPDLNNDHVLDPDGEHIFLSANNGHCDGPGTFRTVNGCISIPRPSPASPAMPIWHACVPAAAHSQPMTGPRRCRPGPSSEARGR